MKKIYSIVSDHGHEKHYIDKIPVPSFNNNFISYARKFYSSPDNLDILFRFAKGEFSPFVDMAFEKYLNRLQYLAGKKRIRFT